MGLWAPLPLLMLYDNQLANQNKSVREATFAKLMLLLINRNWATLSKPNPNFISIQLGLNSNTLVTSKTLQGSPYGFWGICLILFRLIRVVNFQLETSIFHQSFTSYFMRRLVSALSETQKFSAALHPYHIIYMKFQNQTIW